MKPQRIQLSRRAGFNLQQASLKLNGLSAVNCSRPSMWGNPFKVTPERSQIFAVGAFRTWLTIEGVTADIPEKKRWFLDNMGALRGKNLACWCDLSKPCHCDVLLELANR